jgi:hypothetical protein
MKEPERFIRSRGRKGQLLASAKGDTPPADSRRRAMVAAAAAVAASSKVASAAGTFGALGRLAIWKWVALGAIGASTVVAARAVIPRARSGEGTAALTAPVRSRASMAPPAEIPTEVHQVPPSDPYVQAIAVAPQTTISQAASAPPVSPPPPKVSRAPLEGDVTRTSEAPRPPAPVATSRLSVEIAIIDAAKRALAGGDAAEALRQLDAYRAAFPAGTLAAEATALRIEAMVRAGRRQEARALLDELKLNHPDSPLLDRLAPIVGE